MHSIFVVAITFVQFLAQALVIAIILRAVFSWFDPQAGSPVSRLLIEVTEPIISPLRRVVPTIGMLDLSPFVAILLIQYVFAPLLITVLSTAAKATLG